MSQEPIQPPGPPPPRATRAGGIIIAFTTIAGALWGGIERQMSAGLLLGLGLGALLSILLWLWDRQRRG